MRKKILKTQISLILLALAIILAAVQVVIYNQKSTTGQDLALLQQSISDIERENNRLIKQIASSSSIGTILTKAESLNFADNVEIISLDTSLPVALNSASFEEF